MIVITGLRSGTSLMMQTIRLMGISIAGLAFHEEFSHKELNPRGYWNLPMIETLGGIHHHDYKGMAVKLGGGDLFNTPIENVNKVIWCRRFPYECKRSIKKLTIAEGFTFENETIEQFYILNTDFTLKFKEKFNSNFLEIYYESMLLDSENTIKKIADFLHVEPNINICMENITKGRVCHLQQ